MVAINERGYASRVSWGAILAGAVCSFALQAVLILFAISLGLEIVDDGDMTGFGWGAGIFLVMTGIMSLFAGGSVAGRLSGQPFIPAAALHGAVVWGLVTIVGFYSAGAITSKVATLAGSSAQTIGSAIGTVAGSTGSAIQSVVPDLNDASLPSVDRILPASLQRDLEQLLQREGLTPEELRQEARAIAGQVIDEDEIEQAKSIAMDAGRRLLRNPGDADQIFETAVGRLTEGPNAPLGDQQIDELADVLQNRTGITQAEAQRQVEEWRTEFQQSREELVAEYRSTLDTVTDELDDLRQEAEMKAKQVADAAASFALWSAIALIIGLAAACAGAAVSSPDDFDKPV